GDAHAAKPAPDTYLGALAGLGVAANEAVAFEDSPTGVRAAKAAGLRCVAVPNPVTAVLAFPGADLVLPSLEALALPELLTRLSVWCQRHGRYRHKSARQHRLGQGPGQVVTQPCCVKVSGGGHDVGQ